MGLENPLHIIIILAVVFMLFGAKRLPEMGRGLGDGLRGFKEAVAGQSTESSPSIAAALAEVPSAPELEPAVAAAPPAQAAQAAATSAPVGAGAERH